MEFSKFLSRVYIGAKTCLKDVSRVLILFLDKVSLYQCFHFILSLSKQVPKDAFLHLF